jgi:hypothetical protein
MPVGAVCRQDLLALERGGNQIAGGGGQVGDVADRARARALGGAEGFTDQIRNARRAVLPGEFGGLHEIS